jgi:hypothetical protein
LKSALAKIILATLGATAAASISGPADAAIVTYDVNLTFDPNATAFSTLGPAGPGTVKGTVSIDTSIPFSTPTGNLVAVNLTEQSNDGTLLSVFSNSPTQIFNTVTPYTIIFLWSPVTEYPAQSSLVSRPSGTYEEVSFSSGPLFDSIQMGPSIQFDFPYTAGGAVIPGNFDSIASTGFNAYLFGTVTPVVTAGVPEPSTWAMMLLGLGGLGAATRWRNRRSVATA